MLKFPWGRSRSGCVGLHFASDGVGIAYGDGVGSSPVLKSCEWFGSENGAWPIEHMQGYIDKQRLKGRACNVVLAAEHYSLLLVEAPNVPPEEMRDAVKFRIKDLITFPLEEALVDVFALPEDSSRSGRKMIYAVVSQRHHVMQVVDLISQLGLKLNAVDVSELALRNVLERLQQNDRGVAGLYVVAGKATLALLRDGHLYLTRQFDLSYNGGLFDDLPSEQLTLELQRSLDYYERQMGQMPPDCVYLFGDNITSDKLDSTLSNAVAGGVSCLDLSTVVQIEEGVDTSVVDLCVGAVGAMLRQGAAA